MTENKEKPYLSIAAICQHVIEEKDGVISGIRFIDRLTLTNKGEGNDGVMPVIPMPLGIIIAFKAGNARGKRSLTVRTVDPQGRIKGDPLNHALNFGDEENGGVNVIIRMAFMPEEPGIYWIDVELENEIVTRMPIQILYVEEPV